MPVTSRIEQTFSITDHNLPFGFKLTWEGKTNHASSPSVFLGALSLRPGPISS